MAGLSLSQRPASMAHAGLGSCTRALLLTVPLALAACGGGSSSDSDTAAPPSGLNVGYGTKAYHFSWSAAPNATRYELFEDPDGAAGPQPEVQIGGAITGTAYAHSLAAQMLHERVNASYRLRACDANGCRPFSAAATPDLTQAIGRFELAGGGPVGRFGSYPNVVVLSADGATLAVGAPSEASTTRLAGAGAVYVFSRSAAGAWSQQVRLQASSPAAKMAFGASLALSSDGNTLAVGAPEERSNARGINSDASNGDAYGAGAVYTFHRSGGAWSQQAYVKARNTPQKVATCSRLDISGTMTFPCTPQHFGFSVALSADGNLLAVGAPEEGADFTQGLGGVVGSAWRFGTETIFGGGVGAVHTFARTSGTWAEQAYLPGSSADPSMARFGAVLALSSDGTVLAASTDKDVSVLTQLSGTWSAPTQVWRQPPERGSQQPFALSGDGSTLAFVDGSAGPDVQLQTFTRAGAVWAQQPALPVKSADRYFSESTMLSLSADGRTLALGNPDDASNAPGINGNASNQAADSAGAVNIYRRTGATWSHSAYLKAPQPQVRARLGISVALSGDASTLAVGTSSATDGVTAAVPNAAYIY
ncbi:MAG: hypothetical protein KDF25_05285 [Burkholderiaceae bacterium]|nr:hypothetical protein [Burkholderiaceae bacterium]